MDSKNTMKQIRILLGMEKAEPEVQVELGKAMLKDGTEISYDKLEVDGVCTIEDAPAPAGDYELEDGTVLVVADGGVITEVKAVEETPMEETPVEETPEETPAEPAVDVEGKITELEQRVAQLEELLLGFSTQMTTMKDEFSSQIKEIADAPASEPIKPIAQAPSNDSMVDKLDFIKKHLNK